MLECKPAFLILAQRSAGLQGPDFVPPKVQVHAPCHISAVPYHETLFRDLLVSCCPSETIQGHESFAGAAEARGEHGQRLLCSCTNPARSRQQAVKCSQGTEVPRSWFQPESQNWPPVGAVPQTRSRVVCKVTLAVPAPHLRQ